MKFKLIIFALILTACSSISPKPEELKQANKCMVWQKDMVGLNHVSEVEGEDGKELAKQKITCWVMNMFLCSYTNYTYRPGTSEILSDLGDDDKTIGRLEGNKMSLNMTGMTVDPAPIQNGKVEFVKKGALGPPTPRTAEYNEACTPRQVALGVASLIHL